MAQVTAGQIVDRALKTLGEAGVGRRWTRPEILGLVNAARREVVAKRPVAGQVRTVAPLVAGVVQAAPDGMDRVDRVVCNTSEDGLRPGLVPGRTTRDELEGLSTSWMLRAAARPVALWAPHETQPRRYYVYPGRVQEDPGFVELEGPFSPADVAERGLLAVGVGDEYSEAILHYALGWAFAKSGEDTELAALSDKHLLAFYQMLGFTGEAAAAAAGGKG